MGRGWSFRRIWFVSSRTLTEKQSPNFPKKVILQRIIDINLTEHNEKGTEFTTSETDPLIRAFRGCLEVVVLSPPGEGSPE